MGYILRVDINIFALVLLVILTISVVRNGDKNLFHTKLFLSMLYSNIALLLCNTLLLYVDGIQGLLAYNLNYYLHIFYHFIMPIPAVLWLYYVDYHIFADENRLRKFSKFYFIPLVVNVLFIGLSVRYDLIYFIDAQNEYQRGSGFILNYVLFYGTLVYTWLLSMKNRKLVNSRSLLGIQLFVVPIFLGAIIQLFFYGLLLIWTSLSLSLLIIFISIEMRQIYRDYLTGASSRRQLDEYIEYRIHMSRKSRGFAISMIDMDDFKEINDTLGHHIGDEALVNMVKLIKESVRQSDFVGRYAGDEFVVVFDIEEEEALNEVLDRIQENVQLFNDNQGDSYKIKFSIGTEIVKKSKPCDFDELFKRIDMKMYDEKKRKKGM